MYRLLIEWSIIVVILGSSLPNAATAQEIPDWTNPIHKCWSIGELSLSSRTNASDNESAIISHLSDQQILATDPQSGKTLWKRELQGQLTSQITVTNKTAYFAVKPKSDELVKINASRVSSQKIEIDAVDIDSGVNNWASSELKTIDNDSEYTILLNNGNLYVVSASGNISAIREFDRSVVWSKKLNTSLTSLPVTLEDNIYLGTENKTIMIISGQTGEIKNQIPFGFEPTSIAISKVGIFAGDKEGNITAIEFPNHGFSWKSVTGGEIVGINPIDDDILVSSNDNFIYRFSGKNGTKVWKRKLAGRLLGNTILDNKIAAFLSVGSNEVLLVDLENGKIVNRISISRSEYFVSAPISIGAKLILPTDQGIEAYSPLCIP